MNEALGVGKGGVANWGEHGQQMEIQECDKQLCTGCRTGDIELVRQALKDGANPAVQFRLALGEITPIFLCASKGYKEIAELLIKHSPEITSARMGFDGTTCLHHAASNDQEQMVELLINNGCNVNKKDTLGRTPLMDAAEIGSMKVIKVLLENGGDVIIEDKEHSTALSYSLDFISKDEPKFFECSVFLVEQGTHPNYAGKFTHRTLLHYAAAQGNLELVKQLIEVHGAALKPIDEQGKLPLDYAMDYNKQDVVEYLQSVPDGSGCGCVVM
mmetsp:Transcript_39087/g.62418  ORF Transcript_39087/g.62418 Transcript_39087/m.62418 type:complete len:272 (-) Transcript_39087:595-1410(-)|eukprot:CAMPEP_0197035976 /NCGR_PEP_ID=MMETSP1384-20130603/13615_1 /TAXON_ID=29189 /ORGANISM="Ammonia sp." /LENGTH=271 /DNA_ID=CAMNT_0042466095 /DNA_START=16 /DNA_END=831 /DNA_ORIENTATION=-